MKRLLFIGALSGAGAREAYAQTMATMTRQMVELKLFNRATVSSYNLYTEGLDSISVVGEKEYLLHVNYFQSLDELSPNIGVDQKKIARLKFLVDEIKTLLYDETPAAARINGRLALPH